MCTCRLQPPCDDCAARVQWLTSMLCKQRVQNLIRRHVLDQVLKMFADVPGLYIYILVDAALKFI